MPPAPPRTAPLTRCIPPALPDERRRCAGCGRTAIQLAASRPAVHQTAALADATGDLECLWLVWAKPRWRTARFCIGCAPDHDRWPIDCGVFPIRFTCC